MKTSDFTYQLPDALIAHYPLANRRDSRLLCMQKSQNNTTINHGVFSDITTLIQDNDILVLNNTKVMQARLYGYKSTGGKVEILIERILSPNTHEAIAHIKANKSPKAGAVLILEEHVSITVIGRAGDDDTLFHVRLTSHASFYEALEKYGHLPLPHYMEREQESLDKQRYQTVFAEHKGAVAAPTAGLHFDDELLAHLRKKGVQIATVTLHVGAGTFQPVRADTLEEHTMHSEWVDVPQATVDAIARTKAAGGRVIAVGTTVVRSLESAALVSGELAAFHGDTDIFITPGFSFKVVDCLITNFHLPESTLLMLVSAFMDKSTIMHAYEEAVAQSYRFFSYGDAMWLDPAYNAPAE